MSSWWDGVGYNYCAMFRYLEAVDADVGVDFIYSFEDDFM
jgi:hypothetical protein